MRVRSVRINNRRKAFEVRTSARRLLLPFAKVQPKTTAADPIDRAYVDKEIASEGFTSVLRSGREGTVHADQVLEDNKDPDHITASRSISWSRCCRFSIAMCGSSFVPSPPDWH